MRSGNGPRFETSEYRGHSHHTAPTFRAETDPSALLSDLGLLEYWIFQCSIILHHRIALRFSCSTKKILRSGRICVETSVTLVGPDSRRGPQTNKLQPIFHLFIFIVE